MRKFDRMEWPKRYKMKSSVLLLIVLAILFGLWQQQRQNKKVREQVQISELYVSDWGSQYVELNYRIANLGKQTLNLKLLAKVWDENEQLLASTLFEVEIPAQSVQTRSKLLDRLERSLKEGESPGKAQIILYQKNPF